MENNLSLVKRLHVCVTVPPQLKEAIECYQLTAYWATRLDVGMDAVREGARSISECNGITFREALDRYGYTIERARMKKQLVSLPLVASLIELATFPHKTRRMNREMRRRIKHGKQ